MSTPYVGLKQVFQETVVEKANPWVETEKTPAENAVNPDIEAKSQLIQILEKDFGVLSIVVGAFQMKLSEEVPNKHLLKSAHYLLEQLKHEPHASSQRQLLEACLQRF
jgi:hypothetical protein